MKRLVYIYWGVVRDDRDLYHAGLSAGYTLLLSNSIRRDTSVVMDMVYRGVDTRLEIDGWRVRHLRLDYSSLLGFMRRALQGRMPGVRVTRPRCFNANLCIWIGDTRDVDAWVSLPPPTRLQAVIVYARGSAPDITCRYVIGVRVGSLQPWLGLGVLQAMLDRWEHGPAGRAGGEGGGDSGERRRCSTRA